MGSLSPTRGLVVLLIILILFVAGKLPRLTGDLAKGISLKANLKEPGKPDGIPIANVTHDGRTPAQSR